MPSNASGRRLAELAYHDESTRREEPLAHVSNWCCVCSGSKVFSWGSRGSVCDHVGTYANVDGQFHEHVYHVDVLLSDTQ